MIVIQLTAAYNPGDLDPGQVYPHIKVAAYHIYPDSKHIQLWPQYGSASLSSSISSSWRSGVTQLSSVDIADTNYVTVLLSASQGAELPFDAAGRIFHKYLLDNGYFTGSLLSSSA